MSSSPSSSKPASSRTEEPIDAELEVLPPADHRQPGPRPQNQALAWIVQHFMDNLIHVPGTKARVGLTPVLELLLPGLGDGASVVISAITIVEAARRKVPKVVMARMALNILLNGLIGTLPFVGEAFAFWFKPSARNYQLLQKHTAGSTVVARRATPGDWTFVIGLIVLMVVVMAAFIAVGAYLVYRMYHYFAYGH